jgi:hypothetical protein
VDINLARQLNLFVYPVRDLMVTTIDGQQVKGLGWCHKVFVHIQNWNYKLDIMLVEEYVVVEDILLLYLIMQKP